MIGLANPALLVGLVVVAAPVVIHLVHRRRFHTVKWGATRFLFDLLRTRGRRLAIEHWLLLTVRCLGLLLLALALCRPYLAPDSAGGAIIERSGAVAAVLLVDDSLSSGAGRGGRSIDQLKILAEAYLGTLRKGDEISILTMSRLGEPAADPIFDRDSAQGILAAIKPTAVSSDIPALLDAGIEQLVRHVNPAGELVLISDGSGDGWHAHDAARWDELRRRLAAPAGGRAAVRVVMLSPTVTPGGGNLAIDDIRLDRSLIPCGRPVGITVSVAQLGGVPLANALVRLSVDGRSIGEQRLVSGSGSSEDVLFTYSFAESGSHLVEASIEGARDQLARDDHRTLAVEVESSVAVLLVEGSQGEDQRGCLEYVSAALDPADDDSGLFAVTRVSAASFRGEQLDQNRVVVLGDVTALDAATIAALEAFVVSGGGILVAPGPASDLSLINRGWSRGGHGFLPVPLDEVVTPESPPVPSALSLGHPALGAFGVLGGKSQEAWRSALIGRYVTIPAEALRAEGVKRLVTLSNGAPLVVERARGHGRVVMFTSSLDLSWNDVPRTAAFVPLVRGLVSHLAAVTLPPRNLSPGKRITWLPPAVIGVGSTLLGPSGTDLPLSEGSWEGHRALSSAAVVEPGGYTLRVPGGPTVRFAVAPAPAESRLDPLADADLAKTMGGQVYSRFAEPQAVTAAFTSDTRRIIELWRFLIIGSVLLLVCETVLTRLQARSS